MKNRTSVRILRTSVKPEMNTADHSQRIQNSVTANLNCSLRSIFVVILKEYLYCIKAVQSHLNYVL